MSNFLRNIILIVSCTYRQQLGKVCIIYGPSLNKAKKASKCSDWPLRMAKVFMIFDAKNVV